MSGKASPKKVAPALANTNPAADAPIPTDSAGELTLAELAQAILSRQIARPRVAQLRRLAEAVLAGEEKRARRKDKSAQAKKGSGKRRKLAKIPKQKKRA